MVLGLPRKPNFYCGAVVCKGGLAEPPPREFAQTPEKPHFGRGTGYNRTPRKPNFDRGTGVCKGGLAKPHDGLSKPPKSLILTAERGFEQNPQKAYFCPRKGGLKRGFVTPQKA